VGPVSAIRLFAIGLFVVCAGTASQPAEAAFPGTNGKIAFQSDRDGNMEIYVMSADGSGQVNVSNNPTDDRTPAWSADGRQIAFSSTRDGNAEIYKMNADGSGQTRLTVNPARDLHPAWTSDGRIVFDRGADVSPFACTGSTDVYIMNADGTGVSNLTNNPAEDCAPSGSANGRIAFMSSRDDQYNDIYSMNLDGSGVVRLTNTPACEQTPNWAPGTTRIAFVGATTNCDDDNIYVMAANGTGRTSLTDTTTRDEVWPAWSPQEDRIAFQGCVTSGCQIYVISAVGGGEVQLTSTGSNGKPDWQPRANQMITFGSLANKTFGDQDFTVSASASSGLPVSFAASGNCTASGVTVHLTGAGSCTVTASQSGDSGYNPAPSVSQSFSIAKANQTITFAALANKTFGARDFDVSANASSSLPVTFTASGSCTISRVTVHLTGAGSCTVTASQPGDANYNAALDVTQSFSIARAPCTVPKVVGKPLAAAKRALGQRHCRTGKLRHAYSAKKKGIVIAQSRRSGKVIPAGSKIDLVVSRGRRL
jgi:Tol biopolymer transport system component